MAEIVYARLNALLEDEFTLLGTDAARTPITGKVQGDFTLLLSRGSTAGISTAGVTITEIGAGKYYLSISAATLSVTGVWVLRVSITVAGQAYVFEGEYAVTTDGTPSGTTGSASFTATASNGRVTNGATALPGATVYIRDPSSNLYTSLTSSATGVWGPVNFVTSGTYSVFTQLAGYSQGSASIIVSGASATLSPASDIAMTAISVGSGMALSELVGYARRMMYDKTGTKAQTELVQSVNLAVDMIAKARLWPHYVTRGQLTLSGALSTGTLTLAVGSTTVTLVGSTWPTWAGTAKLLIGGQVYQITARTDSTHVVIEAAWQDPLTTTSGYTIFQDTIALPQDLYRFGRLVPGQHWPWGGDATSPERLIEQQMLIPFSTRGPVMWTFIDESIVVYPYPSQDVLCGYWYYRRPTPLVNNTDEADWSGAQIELLYRAIDYQVAVLYGQYTGGTPEQAMARYEEAMGRAAPNDRGPTVLTSPMGPGNGIMDIPVWMRRTQ